MTTLWALLALGFFVFVALAIPYAWEEHKRSDLERAVAKFVEAMGAVTVTITASRKQVMELSKALEKVMRGRG